jgi:SNF2 family DNA or RNA helicase
VVWVGCDFGLENWLQLNARLRRPGQTSERVIVHRILARNTVDEVVVEAIERKIEDEQGLKDAMKAYQEKRERADER